MEVEVLLWYQDTIEGGHILNWEAFTCASQLRFGAIAYDDLMEALTRLKQTNTVASY